MIDPNRALFEMVVRLLAPVLDDLVFVGGCTTGLFITDPAAAGIRATKDVDAIVDVVSYAKYAALAERLCELGLAEDTTPGAPLCRWRRGDLLVDVMPVDEQILGFSNRWYPTAIETAQTFFVARHTVRVVTPALFIATKLEAFHGRGDGDAFASHDLEDIIAVVDGRPELGSDVAAAPATVRDYIAAEVRSLLGNRDFVEALAGYLLPDAASQARRGLLEARLQESRRRTVGVSPEYYGSLSGAQAQLSRHCCDNCASGHEQPEGRWRPRSPKTLPPPVDVALAGHRLLL